MTAAPARPVGRPRYGQYRASGVEWLGDLPAHWEVQPFKLLAAVRGGLTPKDEPRFWNGNVPWVTPKDMKTDLILQSEDTVTQAAVQDSGLMLFEPGALLMVVRSGILRSNLPVAMNAVAVTVNQDMKVLTFGPRLLARYAYYLFAGAGGALLPLLRKVGTTVESVQMGALRNLSTPVPPIEEQQQIITFLDHEVATLDALHEKQTQMLGLIGAKRHALISEAVTRGISPNVPLKASGVQWVGDIPAHWSVGPLKQVLASMEQGWSPQCLERPSAPGEWGVLKVGCVNGNTFDPAENKALPPELTPMPRLAINKGDLLVSRANTRELVGSAALAQQDYPNLLLCDKLFRLRFDESKYDPRYAVLVLRSPVARVAIELAATGTSSSMVNIAQATIRNLVVPIPSLSEQAEILQHVTLQVDRLDQLSAKIRCQLDLVREHRAALITAAVTGQIDVRAAREETP